MSVDYPNKTIKYLLILLLFLSLLPTGIAIPDKHDKSNISVDETEMNGIINSNPKNGELISINTRFIYSLAADILTILLIIVFIYYPNYKKLDTVFTFIIFNIVIFLITFALNKVRISMGAAFGLFAVFSMLRYRTEGIDMKDMTYLFVFIALGLLTGIELDLDVLLVVCGIIFLMILILESRRILKRESYQTIEYERIEMIKPEVRKELIKDLKERTGLNIHRISICNLNYLKDTALIRAYYYE
ncbi:MAG TPA: DUF4956 domain-containing protein [Lentimicrobium sp.]|nr:DUF4956 domain-containing protein [Lentimicrobium sp.]